MSCQTIYAPSAKICKLKVKQLIVNGQSITEGVTPGPAGPAGPVATKTLLPFAGSGQIRANAHINAGYNISHTFNALRDINAIPIPAGQLLGINFTHQAASIDTKLTLATIAGTTVTPIPGTTFIIPPSTAAVNIVEFIFPEPVDVPALGLTVLITGDIIINLQIEVVAIF